MKLSVLTLAFLLLTQQQPPAVRGRIEGTVFRENTQEPISGARVTVTRVNAQTGAAVATAGTIGTFLINPTPNVALPPAPPPNPPAQTPAPQPNPIPPVLTDRSGKFLVPDLDEGAYRVAVTLNGYVKQEYGQRAFTGQGTTLNLAKSEVLKDLVVRMTRAGNVNGRLSDENGLPAPGVPIQMLKVSYNAQGVKLVTQAGIGRTNDRGEYRLYWLTPGRYYLAAGTPPGIPPGGGPGGVPSPNETPDPFVFTYYPGTPDQNRALVVDIKAGSDIPMDFVVPRTQLFKVSGRVAPPTNVQAPPPAGNVAPGPPIVNITLGFLRLEGGSGFIAMSQTYDPATGNFELRNIVPGSYAIQANAGNSTARLPIEVVNADLTNLVLSLSAGVTIQGRVQVAGGAPMPTTPVRIQLKPVFKGLPHFVGFVPAAQANPADGLFRFDRTLPGEYRATVQAAGHYVKEVRFENSDALNSSFDLSEGRPLDPTLDIVLSPNVAQLDGIVMDDRGQPLPGAQAVLVPNQNRDRFELFKAGTTDQAGRFSMRDVAPGDYKLFAWDSLDNFAYFEPEFISKYETQGKAVHVDESARVSVETKVIPEAR